MEYVVNTHGSVSKEFVDEAIGTIESINERIKIEDIPTLFLEIFQLWSDFKKEREGKIYPTKLFGSKRYEGVAASSKVEFREGFGFVGQLFLVEELFEGLDPKILVGSVGHEMGHIKRDVDRGFVSDLSLFNRSLQAFKPYFKNRLMNTASSCREIVEDFHAESNFLDTGFFEESLSCLLHQTTCHDDYLNAVRANPRLQNIEAQMKKVCPYFFLETAWYQIVSYVRGSAAYTAFISHKNVPQILKSRLVQKLDEHRLIEFPEYLPVHKKILDEFSSNPSGFMGESRLPFRIIDYFKDFTKNYLGIDFLPTIEQQERMIKGNYKRLKDLSDERHKILSEIAKKLDG